MFRVVTALKKSLGLRDECADCSEFLANDTRLKLSYPVYTRVIMCPCCSVSRERKWKRNIFRVLPVITSGKLIAIPRDRFPVQRQHFRQSFIG